MKYRSDNLLDFEFHDAELSFLSFADHTLTVSVRELNIHKDAPQNLHPADMEIKRAVLTFHDFSLLSYDSGETWSLDGEGKWCLSEKGYLLNGRAALEKFLHELGNRICVFRFGASGDDDYSIEGSSAGEPWFEVHLAFRSVTIEWDEYCGRAWYEEKRQQSQQ